MKKIGIFILAALLSTGCNEEFVNLEPLSQVTSTNFYRTISDFNLAANGIYNALHNRDYNVGLFVLGEISTKNVTVNMPTGAFGDAFYQADDYIVTPDNRHLQSVWQASYVIINRANILLDRSQAIDLRSSLQRNYEGEAFFLRAMAYFNLVRFFGDVPLILNEISPNESFTSGRTPVARVYQQIVEDLQAAIQRLPEAWQGNNVGRATSWAARALLAKALLSQPSKDPARAAQLLQEIQNSGRFILLPNFADVFRANNANHRESIFEVQFKAGLGNRGSYFADGLTPATRRVNQLYPTGAAANGQGQGVVTNDLFNLFEAGDLRRDASIGTSIVGADMVRFQRKYNAPTAIFLDGEDNLIVLRYADVLLMLAEALNEQNSSAKFAPLNEVRRRAGLDPVDQNRFAGQDAFRRLLLQERRREFAFEIQNWFDAVRLGLALEEFGPLGMKPHQIVYPIPQRELDVARGLLTQNPGY